MSPQNNVQNENPAHPAPVSTGPQHTSGKKKTRRKARGCLLPMLFGGLFLLALLLVSSVGALAGYQTGTQAQQAVVTELSKQSVQQQYDLAVQEIAQGSYDTARQRLEWVIAANPGYPGVADRLAQVQSILFATATPTLVPPTFTPTPTRDLRPVQELFAQAEEAWKNKRWDETIDTLLALRSNDPTHQTARVDGMLYIALRERGVSKIWSQGLLEGGIYDLALASRFGPLDVQSLSSRDLARLYITGNSFFEVYPEEAVKYFSQVAAAAPALHDATGVTAAERYFESLVQYGDKLMESAPCDALEQYNLAGSMGRSNAELEAKTEAAYTACYQPTKTPGPATPTTQVNPTATTGGEQPTNTPPTPPTSEPPTSEPPTNTPEPPTNTPEPPPVETTEPPPVETTEPPAPDITTTVEG
jgi:hypothetical protein